VPAEARSPLRLAGRVVAALVAVGFVGLLAYGVLNKAASTTIDDGLKRSRAVRAPGFDLPVLQRGALGSVLTPRLVPAVADGRVSLAELRGTPVVLNFWASWCAPCREEGPLLERAWTNASQRGVLLLGLNMQDVPGDARDFAHQLGITYLNVRDRGNRVAHSYGVTGLPETFFISPAGRVVGHVIGAASAAQLRDGIAAALAGRPLGLRSGGERRKTR
jgi:cytochrome c biogenesis protein CcmG/thiol:disulfide interchange protein DsbE